ncbi:MAG: winged helix-turn-helix transcriptional regulator [Solirubrobacterales bacterium]
MLDREYDTQTCSIARSLEVVGERWSILILRSITMGATKFDDLQKVLGITRSVLTTRLRRMTEFGVIEKKIYSEHPPRYKYLLTDKGKDLWPVLVHLMRWGDEYYLDPAGKPTIIEHYGCGGEPDLHLNCDKCGRPLEFSDLRSLAGPGRRPIPA